jgi:hypothetical protein
MIEKQPDPLTTLAGLVKDLAGVVKDLMDQGEMGFPHTVPLRTRLGSIEIQLEALVEDPPAASL